MTVALILAALTLLGVYGLSRPWDSHQTRDSGPQPVDGHEGQVMPPAA